MRYAAFEALRDTLVSDKSVCLATVIEIERRGGERFGKASGGRRDRNDRGWSGVIARYLAVCRTAPPGLSDEAS